MNRTKFLSLFLCLIMLFGIFPISSAPIPVMVNDSAFDFEVGALLADEEGDVEQNDVSDVFSIISEGIGLSAAYLGDELEEFHRNGSVAYGLEWHVISLLRAGKTIDDEILLEYYNSLVETVKGWTVETTPTNIERCALAISAMDKDITDVDGVNLAELIYNNTALETGSNKLVFALLALDAAGVEIPENALWSRDAIITELLKYQTSDGAFGLALDNLVSDVDMTAMCIQSLAPYTGFENVNDAVNDAVEYLKRTASEEFDYLNNAYSTAQVLLALSCLGIDVTDSDSGFGNGEDENIVTALGKYKSENTNGYISENGVLSSSATYQVMQAYDAYRKAFKENLSYWDFSVKGQIYDDGGENEGEADNDEQEAASANVYVTLVSDASVVTDKNGEYVAAAKVTVADLDKNGIHTVDEVLYAAHEAYYDGGAQEGYASQNTAHGLSVAKLWGKGSLEAPTSCGYYLNNNSCWSLADEVKEGDYIVAFNYYDTIGWSDSYAYFDVNTTEVNKGKTVTLTLNCLGYDASWNIVSSPCKGANVEILGSNNSAQKVLTTNKNGKVKINFPKSAKAGDYYVVACKDDNSIVPCVCRITVKDTNNTVGSGTAKDIKVYIKISDPEGETYLKKVSYSVKKGTTAFELLEKTGLDIDVSRSVYGMYVSGIEDLAEFDEGEGSGWMYRVNRKFPSISSSMYALSKGDYVEWLYTRDFGEDLGQSKSSGVSSSKSDKEDVEEEITDVPQNTDKTQEEAQKNVFGDTTFADVKSDNWYYDSVKYVYENNLMQGTDNGFEPDSNMSRAMLVTVLYRMDNGTKSEYTHLFSDVSKEKWYADAVSWAVSNGIIKGVTETEFAPDSDVSREQMALIMYRFAKMKGYDVNGTEDVSAFSDVDNVSEWAIDAVKWAKNHELINGTDKFSLSPKASATRAQIATIIMRFCENLAK
ncbi:MAG: S-layer homology domain-containing protein [Clostridia bacterium]|nr:S-layer homology domain-containing protein [Clostridia bacterium]